MWVNMELQFNFFKHALMIHCRHWWLQIITAKISGDKVISDQCMRRLKEFDCFKVDPFLPCWTSSLLKKKCSAPARSYVPPATRHTSCLLKNSLRTYSLVTLSLPEWIATSIHANETSSALLSQGAICFLSYLENSVVFDFAHFIGVKRLDFY